MSGSKHDARGGRQRKTWTGDRHGRDLNAFRKQLTRRERYAARDDLRRGEQPNERTRIQSVYFD